MNPYYPDWFKGDGRSSCHPLSSHQGLPCTQARSVSRANARKFIDHFMRTGESNHSAAGSTLWVILTYCQLANVPYRMTAIPSWGYRVERADDLAKLT